VVRDNTTRGIQRERIQRTKNPVSSARDFRCCRPFVSTATAQGCAGRPCQSGQSSDTWPQSLAKVISQSVTCLCHLGRPQWTCSADSSPTESGRQILGNSSFTPCFDTYSLETRQFFPTSTIKVCRIPPPVRVSDQWNLRIDQKAIRHHLHDRRNQSRTR
jgi:hypothetical protein